MNEPEKILIIRLSSIGDIILSYPLIIELNRKYPDCEIDYLTSTNYQKLLQPLAHLLTNIHVFDKDRGFDEIKNYRTIIKNTEYDWIIDIHNKFRSLILSLFSGAQTYRVKKYRIRRALFVQFRLDIYPETPVYQKYLNTVPVTLNHSDNWHLKGCNQNQILKKLKQEIPDLQSDNPTIIMFPGARHATKRWPLKRYLELAIRTITETNCNVIFGGDEKDAELLENVHFTSDRITNVCGKYNLLETMCLVSLADIIVSNDSGPMHMGAAFHKHQIAIFGNTVTDFGFTPLNDRASIIENQGLECRPCSHIGYEKCPKKHFKCMLDIPVKKIFTNLKNLINLQ